MSLNWVGCSFRKSKVCQSATMWCESCRRLLALGWGTRGGAWAAFPGSRRTNSMVDLRCFSLTSHDRRRAPFVSLSSHSPFRRVLLLVARRSCLGFHGGSRTRHFGRDSRHEQPGFFRDAIEGLGVHPWFRIDGGIHAFHDDWRCVVWIVHV